MCLHHSRAHVPGAVPVSLRDTRRAVGDPWAEAHGYRPVSLCDMREVAVQTPNLGEIRLQAPPDGAVYLANLTAGKPVLTKTDF